MIRMAWWTATFLLLAIYQDFCASAPSKEFVAITLDNSETGGHHRLHIPSPLESVHNGVNVFSGSVDENDEFVLSEWPSPKGDVTTTDEKQDEPVKVINENKNESDHERIQNEITVGGPNDNENIVELLIVVDNAFGDLFNQDRRKIIDYWTIYMWDMNLRFKTMKNVRISFQVVGIVAMKDKKAQPYIEQVRNSNGTAEHGKILSQFSSWTYEKKEILPKFDMALVVTRTQEVEGTGGGVYISGMCQVDESAGTQMNVVSLNDDGNWNSITVAAHLMGHSLGAPNDESVKDCKARGFIVSESTTQEKMWFFSSCSDTKIGDFIKSNNSACLRRKDNSRMNLILDPEFDSPLALSMDARCKLITGKNDSYVLKSDLNNCMELRCQVVSGNGPVQQTFETVDNTICGNNSDMRCFRGRCRRLGYLLKNVASGLCIRAKNPYHYTDGYEMRPCPRYGTPLDRIMIVSSTTGPGVLLASPFNQLRLNQTMENDDKCAFASSTGNIRSDRCVNNEWLEWELRDGGNSQYIIMHKRTRRYMKPEGPEVGSTIKTVESLDPDNADEFKWTVAL